MALPSLDDRLLIVGLGNPGKQYRGNRHNVGFMIVDRLAEKYGVSLSRSKELFRYYAGIIEGCRLILAEPLTYMNASGHAVSRMTSFFKTQVENLIVVHDDLDMIAGKVRLKTGGGHGGHNGLRSIIETLATGDFKRLKVGIGRPEAEQTAESWVLQDFSKDEEPVISKGLDEAVDALAMLIRSLGQ